MFVSLYYSIQILVPQIFESMKNSLKIERAKKNITQDDLAKAIGVSRQTINAMEANKYVPSTVLALKLAVYFACSVEEIFQLTEND